MLSYLLPKKNRKVRHAIGLDIGFSSVKMVAVSGNTGAWALYDSAIVSLERDSENPVPATAVKKAVSDTVGRSGLDFSDLRVSVSGKGVIVRLTEMPRMTTTDLKSSIKYEAEMLLPFSLDDCVFDCPILDPEAKENAKMKVALAAARKNVVHERLDLLKDIGLVPKVLSIDSLALTNAFESAMPDIKPDETVSLVHMGASRTILNVVTAKNLDLTRDIEVGGNNATLAIARGLGIDFRQAERRKEEVDPAVSEFMNPTAMVLARELRSTFGYISSKMSKSVSAIYLSGGCALCHKLKETLSAEFGFTVTLWDPLKGISVEGGPGREGTRGKEALLAVAAGLAVCD
jgi:type IV pilus assembly protein PilM